MTSANDATMSVAGVELSSEYHVILSPKHARRAAKGLGAEREASFALKSERAQDQKGYYDPFQQLN